MKSEAYFSECRAFRYWLLRVWDDRLPILGVIGVNPSTADETKNDPTIRKDMGFASRLGFGGILKLNVGAFRATDPRDWRRATDPIGPENTALHLKIYAERFHVESMIAAWGKNGVYAQEQCSAIAKEFPSLQCWGFNGDGTPKHPLMLSYTTKLQPFAQPTKSDLTPSKDDVPA
jgi:hypothetical protein